jgi:HlyD family secretion protein
MIDARAAGTRSGAPRSGCAVKLNSTGAASASEVAAAQQRLETAEVKPACIGSERQQPLFAGRGGARAGGAGRRGGQSGGGAAGVAQTSVHAPVAGTVYSLDAGRTEFVEEGKLLLQLADLHHERVRAYFDEPEIGRLAVGQKIQIKWDAKPGRIWNGHIVRTPVTVINLRHAQRGRGAGEDRRCGRRPAAGHQRDRDGDHLQRAKRAERAARGAALENGKPYVYKVVNNELERTSVTTGTINLTQVAILSGLKEGRLVATGTPTDSPCRRAFRSRLCGDWVGGS